MRRAVGRGALTSAESAGRRALALARGGPHALDATQALVETLGVAGHADEAFALGDVLLGRLADVADVDPCGRRRRRIHIALARVAVAGTDWGLASIHLEGARRYEDEADPADAALRDALAAVVAGQEPG